MAPDIEAIARGHAFVVQGILLWGDRIDDDAIVAPDNTPVGARHQQIIGMLRDVTTAVPRGDGRCTFRRSPGGDGCYS